MYYLLTKTDCIHCETAKALLKEKGEEYQSWAYDDHPMILKLMKLTGLKTVPQIWHDHVHIGGAIELKNYLP